ncbi:MAG: L,D-transpeptidase family protein [Phycisphaera sp.]|nr:L,D-transpeptidase family protein [Phycisphaera sp.]
MALASQSGRSSSRRSYMSSRRRPQRRRFLLLLFLVACVVAAGWWWLRDDGTAEGTEQVAAAAPGTTPGTTPDETDPGSTAADRRSEITLDPGPDRVAARPGAGGSSRSAETSPGADDASASPTTATAQSGTSRPAPAPPSIRSDAAVSSQTASASLADAQRLAKTDPVAAREALTTAWVSGGLSASDRRSATTLARQLAALTLLDRPNLPENPFVTTYKVRSGDSLDRIVRRENVDADKMFLARINNLSNPNAIRIGQELRLPAGTFDAVVDKSDYTMTLFQRTESGRTMLVALPVGLGEFNATPTGLYRVRVNSKLVNPHWINPRTREEFKANDPANPIGEHWIGLEGIEDSNRDVDGYGIHGTIEPESIGRQMSMGCVRMLGDDVELVYEVLTHPASTIEIRD